MINIPLEQGLKPRLSRGVKDSFPVMINIPLEQGLKLYSII